MSIRKPLVEWGLLAAVAIVSVTPGARAQSLPAELSNPDTLSEFEPLIQEPSGLLTLEKVPLHYQLEAIQVRGNVRTRGRVVLRYVPFAPGQLLDVDDPEIELTRFRLLGTGFFQSVSLSLRKGSRHGAVVLVIRVVERNTMVVNDVWLGLSASADNKGNARPLSAYGGADVAETNLIGTGITLSGAFAIAEDQLALRLRFLDTAFLGSSWMIQGTLYHHIAREFYGNHDVLYDDPVAGADRVQDYATVRYRRLGGTLGAGHDLSVSSQLWFDFRLEQIDADLPLAASHRRGLDTEPIDFNLISGKSVLSSVRGTLLQDTRDTPFLPTRGWYTTLSGDVSLAPFGSSYPYERTQVRAVHWWSLGSGHVLDVELFAGAVSKSAPVYEKFYIGDFTDLLPDRVLGLTTDSRPAPNFFGTAIREVRYGDYAAKVQGEYRIPIYRGSRSVYGIDLFTAAGVYLVATQREFSDPARGYRGLARIPADWTFNLGLRMDTSAGGFVLAFSNVLGFLPILRGHP